MDHGRVALESSCLGGYSIAILPTFFVYWFPLSALIAIAPKFIKRGPKFKWPEPSARQDIVILVLINLLVSCWFQLYFTSQAWAQRYPNLFPVVDDRPAQTSPNLEAARSTGVAFLDQADAGLRTNLSGLPWPQAERWLLDLNANLTAISDASKLKLGAASEPWRLEGRISSQQDYQVQLLAIWRDPVTKRDRDYLLKTCAIRRTPLAATAPTKIPTNQVATVQCGATEIPTIAPTPAVSAPTVRSVR